MMNWERWESLASAFLAAAEIAAPILRPELLILPAIGETAAVQVMAPLPVQENPAAKLTMLYRENLLETARTNAYTDTYQVIAFKGNISPVSGPPRRRQWASDRFVFTWDDSLKPT